MPEENLKSTVKVRKPDDKAQDGDTAGIFWADIAIVKQNKEKIETDVNDNLVEETPVRALEDAISLKRRSWLHENLENSSASSRIRVTDL